MGSILHRCCSFIRCEVSGFSKSFMLRPTVMPYGSPMGHFRNKQDMRVFRSVSWIDINFKMLTGSSSCFHSVANDTLIKQNRHNSSTAYYHSSRHNLDEAQRNLLRTMVRKNGMVCKKSTCLGLYSIKSSKFYG